MFPLFLRQNSAKMRLKAWLFGVNLILCRWEAWRPNSWVGIYTLFRAGSFRVRFRNLRLQLYLAARKRGFYLAICIQCCIDDPGFFKTFRRMGYEKNGAISTNSDYRHVCSPKSSFFAHSAKFFRTNTFFNRISNLENSIFLGNLIIIIKTIAQKQLWWLFYMKSF